MEIPYYTSKMINVYDPFAPPDPVEGLNYETVLFCSYQHHTDLDHDGYRDSEGYTQNYVQSKYPPFVCKSSRGYDTVLFYGDGLDSLKENISIRASGSGMTWDSAQKQLVPRSFNASIYGLKIMHHEFLNTSSQTYDWRNSTVKDRDGHADLFLSGAWPDEWVEYGCIVSPGSFKDIMFWGPNVNVLKNGSSWSVPSGQGAGGYDVYHNDKLIAWITYEEDGYPKGLFYTATKELQYRVIKGMSFQSGQEWLAWCKEH